MAGPKARNVNDYMQSFFGRTGEIINIDLAVNATTSGVATPVPDTDVEPWEAVHRVVTGRTWHTLALSSGFTGTVNFEASTDGTNYWPQVPSSANGGTASSADITAPGIYLFHGLYESARIYLPSALTSGTVYANLRSVLA